MLDLHRLRIFRSVVASGSINAAAAHLGYTPSTVSQHVATLQRETGLKLLTHVGRGVEPTAAGRELAQMSGAVLTRLAQVETRVKDLRDGRTGTLTIHTFDSASTAWMPTVTRAVLAAHPELRLRLTLIDHYPGPSAPPPTAPAIDSPDSSAQEAADLHVVIADGDFEAPTGYRVHRLLQEPYVALVPAGHRLAGAGVIELAELRDETWIAADMTDGPCALNLRRSCAAGGFEPAYSVETTDHVTAMSFVAAGVGITVLPQLCALTLPDGVVALQLENPTPQRTIYALVNGQVEDSRCVQLALATLQDCARASTLDELDRRTA